MKIAQLSVILIYTSVYPLIDNKQLYLWFRLYDHTLVYINLHFNRRLYETE